MSAVTGKNERQCIVGSPWGESKSDAMDESVALNSYFTLRVHGGGTVYNENGILINAPGYYVGAMLGGIVASTDFNEPLTWKQLRIIQLENEYTRSDHEDLLEKGVCFAYRDEENVIKVLRQLTTFQGNDIIKNEWTLVRGMLMVTKDLRMFMERQGVGKKGKKQTFVSLQQDAINRMKEYVVLGYLAEDPNGEIDSWKLNDFTITADKIYIEWTGLLVAPINFIFIQNNFTVIGVL